MLYYRYRSGSELSIKELIYDELYFASQAECNDPYEGKVFAVLNKDEELWNNLIRIALKFYSSNTVEYLIKRVVDYFVSKAPLYLNELITISKSEFINLGKTQIERIVLSNMLEEIKQYASLYMPAEQYFASFSKRNDNYLMWSHYANNHSGFCLIFRALDGRIQQNPKWMRKSISYSTPKAFSKKMSFAIPESFEIKKVEYSTKPKCLDGFMGFPAGVSNDRYTPQEIDDFQKEYSDTYMKKHTVWDYEEEYRVVLSSGMPWLTGERMSVSSQQRLFHYNSTQLVGIVLGNKMPYDKRQRIKEIIAEKVERWYIPTTGHRIISDFVLFEEKLSETNREVKIEPVEIYSCSSVIDKSHKVFEKSYKNWQDGYAIKFEDTKASRIQLK